MTEEVAKVVSEQDVQAQPQEGSVPSFNPFDDSAWEAGGGGVEGVASNENIEAEPNEPTSEAASATQPDYNSYIKEKFGFDSEEMLSKELARLKEQGTQAEFANDDSRKLFDAIKSGKKDEVYSILERDIKLTRLSTVPIDNADVASDIIKESLRSKYSDLNDDEIHRKFEKLFPMPKKPNQEIDELDEEYLGRLSDWERDKSEAEKDIMIEAKIVRKDIESLKSQLVLPDFDGGGMQKQLSQEDLRKLQEVRDAYVEDLDKAAKSFTGFNVTAKGEDAELQISFLPTDTEKAAYKDKLYDFDAQNYLSERWLKEDGRVDAQKAISDLFLLENKDAILQKVANEAAAKMLEHIIKTRGNVKLDTGGRQIEPQLNGRESQEKKQIDAIWSA